MLIESSCASVDNNPCGFRPPISVHINILDASIFSECNCAPSASDKLAHTNANTRPVPADIVYSLARKWFVMVWQVNEFFSVQVGAGWYPRKLAISRSALLISYASSSRLTLFRKSQECCCQVTSTFGAPAPCGKSVEPSGKLICAP